MSDHSHAGHHCHHFEQSFADPGAAHRIEKNLFKAFLINLVFMVVEIGGGIYSNGLVLLADAGHMFTDAGAILLALYVARVSRRPNDPSKTFGYKRAEILGSFFNAVTLVLLCGFLIFQSIKRISNPEPVLAPVLLAISSLGLIANLFVAYLLHNSASDNFNIRGAFLHVLADLLGSVIAMASGTLIYTTGLFILDPLASLLVCGFLLYSSFDLLRQSSHILLEGFPQDLDFDLILRTLNEMEHVTHVHDLHVWTVGQDFPILTVHLELDQNCLDHGHWVECLQLARCLVMEKFGIQHTTIQLEPAGFIKEEKSICGLNSCGTVHEHPKLA